MKTIQYALREIKTGKLLGFTASSNEGGDFCGDTEISLESYSNHIWYAESAEQAEYVRQFPTPWYNAGMETPNHSFEPEELDVVKVERVEEITAVSVQIPTVKEWIELRYRKTEPAHADYLQSSPINSYSFYDLKETLKGRV